MKLGTVVVLDSLSKRVDFGFGSSVVISNFLHSLHIHGMDAAAKFKRCAQMHNGRLLRTVCGSVIMPEWECGECHLHISMTLRTTVNL